MGVIVIVFYGNNFASGNFVPFMKSSQVSECVQITSLMPSETPVAAPPTRESGLQAGSFQDNLSFTWGRLSLKEAKTAS